jgi:hypothetical protein
MVGVIISAILTGLATAGFINLSTKDEKDGSTTILSDGTPIINLPQNTIAQDVPYGTIVATFERIVTNVASKPASPNVRIVNAIKNNRLLNVSLIPDATMKTEGEAIVAVSNSDMLTIKKSSLTNTDAISIPIPDSGLALTQSSSIDISAWNTDGNLVALTVLILTGVKQLVGV